MASGSQMFKPYCVHCEQMGNQFDSSKCRNKRQDTKPEGRHTQSDIDKNSPEKETDTAMKVLSKNIATKELGKGNHFSYVATTSFKIYILRIHEWKVNEEESLSDRNWS